MKKQTMYRISVFVLLGLMVFTWRANAQAKKETSATDKITWVWNLMPIPSVISTFSMKEIPKRVAKATDGRLIIQMNQSLVGPMDAPSAMSEGRIDGGLVTTIFFSGEWPYPNVTALPFLIGNDEELKEVTYKILWDVLEKSYHKKYNLVFLGSWIYANQGIWSNRPLKIIEDFKNVKIRGHNYEAALSLKLMGATPITMPWPEVHMALQRGVMDGVITMVAVMVKSGLYKVTKYANMWPLAPAQPGAWVVNRDTWNRLPEDLKPKVKRVMREITDEIFRLGIQEGHQILNDAESEGIKVIYPNAEQIQRGKVMTAPVYKNWINRCKKTGDPGEELIKKVEALLREMRSK